MWENAQRRKAADPSYDGGEGGAADEGNDDGLPEPPELTEKEAAEQKRLVEKGFATWRAADLKAFVRGCELYGRDDVAAVASEVEGKEEREVARYTARNYGAYSPQLSAILRNSSETPPLSTGTPPSSSRGTKSSRTARSCSRRSSAAKRSSRSGTSSSACSRRR